MQKLLLPHSFKKIGIILLIIGIPFAIFVMKTHWSPDWLTVPVFSVWSDGISTNNITDEIVGIVLLFGCFFTAFSREEVEDNILMQMRVNAFLWAAYFQAAILLLSMVFVYDFSFLQIMMYNLFTPFLVYILRFNFRLYRNIKLSEKNE